MMNLATTPSGVIPAMYAQSPSWTNPTTASVLGPRMSAEAICSTAVGLADLSRGVYTLQPFGGSNRRRASGDRAGSPFPNTAMQVNDVPIGLPYPSLGGSQVPPRRRYGNSALRPNLPGTMSVPSPSDTHHLRQVHQAARRVQRIVTALCERGWGVALERPGDSGRASPDSHPV